MGGAVFRGRRRSVAALLLVLALAACAAEPAAFVEGDALRPGPGLLTGEDGAFVIYGQ